MVRFKMYAEYEDGMQKSFIHTATDCDEAENLCMCDIANEEENHGGCTYYTCVNSVEEDGYWVYGEWFDGYDEKRGMYYKK